jgi:hypothetical protein
VHAEIRTERQRHRQTDRQIIGAEINTSSIA